MQRTMTLRVFPIVAIALAACGSNTERTETGFLAQPAPPADNGGAVEQVAVEIRAVDTQRQLIRIATEDGQTQDVLYDQNTIVMHDDQQRPITALERGDIVLMEMLRMDGATHAGRVDVQQTALERAARVRTDDGALMQVSGRVAQVDRERRTFVLETPTGNVTIALPPYPLQAALACFNGLRVGGSVRLEAKPEGTGHFEIHRCL